MSLILPRRGLLIGLAAMVAAPAVVRASSLMGIRDDDPFVGIELSYQFRGVDFRVTDCVERQMVRKSKLDLIAPEKRDQGDYIWANPISGCYEASTIGGHGIIYISEVTRHSAGHYVGGPDNGLVWRP